MIRMLCAGMLCASISADAAVSSGWDHTFNLEHVEAIDTLSAIAPGNAAAERALAAACMARILFERGTISVDSYLGQVRGASVELPPPPIELAHAFDAHARQALALAQQAADAHPDEAEAWDALAAAHGLLATYDGTVLGNVGASIVEARKAVHAAQRARAIDPHLPGPRAVLATYRYVVSTLPRVLQLLASAAGFQNGREEALHELEEAGHDDGPDGTSALFTLAMLDAREGRYDESLRILALLRKRAPRNRHITLNVASIELLAGRPGRALQKLVEGMRALEADARPRAHGEEGLWRFKIATAQLALGRCREADEELSRLSLVEKRDWVHARSHNLRARIAVLRGHVDQARALYARASELSAACDDPPGVEAAARGMAAITGITQHCEDGE